MLSNDSSDWSLALEGNGEAFGRIFDRHRNRVHRHATRLVPVPADADDVAAITFLEAWRKRATVHLVDGSVLPWLLVTATYSTRNLTRSARRYRALLDKLPLADGPPYSLDEPDHDGAATSALRQLALKDQQVLTLCVIEEFTSQEAAVVLGIPPGTVKSRLSRARTRLADLVTASTDHTVLMKEAAPHGL